MKADTPAGRRYRRSIKRGVPKKKALVAVCIYLLRVAFRLMITKKQFRDMERETPAVRPTDLVSQADAARILNLTRQRINVLVKTGRLGRSMWEGKCYDTEGGAGRVSAGAGESPPTPNSGRVSQQPSL